MMRWLLFLGLAGYCSAFFDPKCNGKQVMVHLFEWKWTDIAAECERYLAGAGYCGVQVSPPMEHVILPENNYPWWQRYQPVSYKLYSRSGSEAEFIDMVHRCNSVGVRIYVDAVVNHMTGTGRSGIADGGSSYNANGDARDFPGVPYSAEHFTPRDQCPSGDGNVNDYSNPSNVRNCYLVGLTDLYGKLDYVREKVAGYFNQLIQIGVAGIRIDAAKHMWPEDISATLSRLTDLPTDQGFPAGSKFYVFQEVIDQNDGAIKVDEYYNTGYVTEFRYCSKIAWGIKDYGQLSNLIDYGWGMARSDRAFIFTDNHDNQRGHGGGGNVITHESPRDYKQAVAYTLAQDYGFTRIMSSYYFTNTDQGPPSNGGYSTADVIINDDGSCGGGWVCEHRWNVMKKMVEFRNAVVGTSMENYWNNGNAVAFSRGNKGFFAMAKQGSMSESLQTGLPAGSYCNIIDDCASSIQVGADGMAQISINNYEEPILAVCAGGCGGGGGTPGPTIPTTTGPTPPPMTGVQRTVVFVKKQTAPGQDLFIRGGIDSTVRPGCTQDITSTCAIDFQMKSLGASSHYDKYNSWSTGDSRLDWYGAEPGQGSYVGQTAEGTPLAWTSNSASSPGYQSLNAWGDHYWMVEFDMDCSQSENGWFEVKSFLTNGAGWESDISQSTCTGSAGGRAPYTSKNHLGRCGFVNVFDFGMSTCQINPFSA
ncbi:alpha-amylase-like isoform X3 [Daphnia pulex]|uniref:alpha-amylase-like isoform X3 n=1 Tax=Daphnia pulex TaxID=6669 RepID=UPI001EE14DC3|nr:alpha-amylase-like isoform X3 [Daphnia pulex]